MPGLLDAHTHMTSMDQVDTMLKNGIVGTGDVAASSSLVENAKPFTIVSSLGMTMGILNGKAYVKKRYRKAQSILKYCL